MSSVHATPGRLIVVALATFSLLVLGHPQAHAASWGTPQTVSSWNTVNGRWTANNELETYTPACVWYGSGKPPAPGVKMHFIVNTAVGGDWPGNPNNSTWVLRHGL
ncbi:hypothetical protein ACFY94_06880 [Streptomyces griseorubiginosus]|uniref:hypothetical protein n=1 Tax=Streptomyces griseorubiginosus TaxID=67304 RepID=UPI0036EDC06C